MTREELFERWHARRETFVRAGAFVDGTKIVDEFLHDLDRVEEVRCQVNLTLREAAAECGYSVEHLARLIRQGRLPNAGRRHAPRLRRSDLPTRRKFARTRTRSYDVNADARTLKNGRQ